MRLGIDFGTTRTVVAAADRGNFPVISFQNEHGDMQSWYPSLIGVRAGQLASALDAQEHMGDPEWTFQRSIKRSLGELSPDETVALGDLELPVFELLVRYLTRLRQDLLERSNLEAKSKEPLEALIAVPANANSNQRFLTMEGFRGAGFRVLGMINEPSAAGIEYAHSHITNEWTARKQYLVVYDLGGGTFDASVLGLTDHHHEVLTDEGIARLGGDDIDEILLELALAQTSLGAKLTPQARYHLLEECRRQKESLHPNTRRIAIDTGRAIEGGSTVMVATDALYARCTPLVERTLDALEAAMARVRHQSGLAWSDIETIYLVGGSSDLPIVGRLLRERYGRRVRRSPYPHSATAIGLAIAADAHAGPILRERFTRHFGVWREAESGRRVIFDPIFSKDTPLPAPGEPPLVRTSLYHPAHNAACFRYLECSRLTEDGQPAGDITPWDEIVFPIDPSLRNEPGPNVIDVRRTEAFATQVIQERYCCDSCGMIEVAISDQTAAYQRGYRLLQPSARKKPKPRDKGRS
jgi:molecular chaperone DnaK (HSP70)